MAIRNDPTVTLTGCWENQLGTRLAITANDAGLVMGKILSEGGIEIDQPVSGYVAPWPASQGVIGLVVPSPETRSVTTWSGHFDLEADVIVTNWLLTSSYFDQNEWLSTRVGHDVFRRDDGLSSPDDRPPS